MRVTFFRSVRTLILGSCVPFIPSPYASAADASTATQPAKPPSTYPQIVRLSYVEGDVRVSRGREADKADSKESGDATGWEQAAANLPLETGFSLVTGKGRAEIEFEDASTVYLGDNSVLTFNDLSTTGGIPHTDIALLSGAASLNVQNMMPGEWFILKTPADNLSMRSPQHGFLRVNSYLDAIAITPQRDMTFSVPGVSANRPLMKAQTITLHNGHRVYAAAPDVAASAEWDRWVATRVASREAAMSAAMKDAGLSSPLPGLADMNGEGHFFACQPYGTCWEPTQGWVGRAALVSQAAHGGPQRGEPAVAVSGSASRAQASSAEEDISKQVELVDNTQLAAPSAASFQSAGGTGLTVAQSYEASHPGALLRAEDDYFPCSPEAVRYLIARDPVTGKEKTIGSEAYIAGYPLLAGYPRLGRGIWGYPYLSGNPWEWAVCHAGTWIHREHRYVWVAGLKRHHREPVCWVKNGRLVGFVPKHPNDVAGKPPINLKYGIFNAKAGKSASLQRIDMDMSKPVKLLDEAPKEFRKPEITPLERAEAPRAEAHSVTNMLVAGRSVSREQAMPITFDRKSQNFMIATRVMQGEKSTTVVEPLGGRVGSAQDRDGAPSTMRNGNYGGEQGRGSSTAKGSSPSVGESRGVNSAGSNGGGSWRASAPAPSGGGGGWSGGGGAVHTNAPSGGGGSPGGGAARSH